MPYFLFFIIVNLLVIFFAYKTVTQYLLLNHLLKQKNIAQPDAFSFWFIGKVFHPYPNNPSITTAQKKIVKNAVRAGLLIVVSKGLVKFI